MSLINELRAWFNDSFGQYLKVVSSCVESSVNSTTQPILSGNTWQSAGERVSLPQLGVSLKTDQPGTLYFDFSNDGTNWDSTFPVLGFRVSANIHEFHTAIKLGRYFRIRFINDNEGDQNYLRLYTYYGSNFAPSIAPMNQAQARDGDAINVRPTNFDDEVVIGLRSDVRSFTKFGYRATLQQAVGEQTIWAAPGNFTPLITAQTFNIVYNAANDGVGTSGALILLIDYVNEDGVSKLTTHTLGSTGSDTSSFSGLGINRVAISATGSANINVSDISFNDSSGATVQAFIPAGSGVTQQAIFHMDSDSNGVVKYFYFNVNKIAGGGSPRVTLKAYVFNRAIQSQFEVFRTTIDTGVENTLQINEPIGFRLSPSDILYFVADTDTNDTIANVRFSLLEYKRT